MPKLRNAPRDKMMNVLMTQEEREATHRWARELGYMSTGAFIRTAITEKVAKALGGENGRTTK
jgi:hypothetical protein